MAKFVTRDIPLDEWNQYEWISIQSFTYEFPLYIRGVKKTSPPDDGFVYDECTKPGDTQQVWRRRQTIDNAEIEFR